MASHQYLVHVNIITDGELTDEQIEELFSYLELQMENGTNVRAEVAYHEQIY